MENEYAQNRLTEGTSSPRLERGDIFMPDNGEENLPSASSSAAGSEGAAPPPDNGGSEGAAPPPENNNPTEAMRQAAEAMNALSARLGQRREEPEVWQGEQGDYPEEFYDRQYHALGFEEFKKRFDTVSPYSPRGVDSGLMRFIAKLPGEDGKELLYSFVNTIAALPLETEVADYDLGLYGSTNLSTIISELKPEHGGQEAWQRERFAEVTLRAEAFRLMHTMNKTVITDGLDQLPQMAAYITPAHLQVLMNMRGVATVMRLFESGYWSLLTGKGGGVTVQNEEVMLGKELKGTELREAVEGKSRTRSIGSLQQQFEALVEEAKGNEEKGIRPNPLLAELAHFQPWEIRLAFNAARLLENLSLRSAEHISMSKVPEGEAAWKGPPKERAVRLFSVIWEWKRFRSGEAAGGMRYLNDALMWYQKLREKQGYGTTHIKTLAGGKAIEDFEAQGMFGSGGGIFAGWRTRGTLLEQAPMVVDNKLMTIHSYIQERRGGRDLTPAILREIFLDNRGELRHEFSNAYGALVKISEITPSDKDSQAMVKIKTEIRTAVLKRMAEENPMALAFLMAGMEFEGGGPFSGGEADRFKEFAKSLNPDENPVYRELLLKLIRANEIRMASVKENAIMVSGIRKEKRDQLQEKLRQLEAEGNTEEAAKVRREISAIYIDESSKVLSLKDILGSSVALTAPEAELLQQIQHYGKDVAGDLAAIRFPYIPIMNDVIWDAADFRQGGAIYYSRKIGDDVNIFQAMKKIEELQRKPVAIKPEDAIEIFKKAAMDLDGPNGREAGQNQLLPFIMALGDMYQTGGQFGGQFGDRPGSGILKWLASDMFIREIAHHTNTPNSVAQIYGGVDAPAFDEIAMNDWANKLLASSLTRKGQVTRRKDGKVVERFADIDSWLRKKYNLRRWGIPFWLAAIFRDMIPIFILGAGNELRKRIPEKQR